MTRGIIVAITAFETVFFLKRKLHRHHWASVAAIVIGVVEVGIVAIAASGKSDSSAGQQLFGIILIFIA